jgi:hypothetical protein
MIYDSIGKIRLADTVGNAAGPIPRGPPITHLADMVGNAAGPIPRGPPITRLADTVGNAAGSIPRCSALSYTRSNGSKPSTRNTLLIV